MTSKPVHAINKRISTLLSEAGQRAKRFRRRMRRGKASDEIFHFDGSLFGDIRGVQSVGIWRLVQF
jgi:hypothetical protein